MRRIRLLWNSIRRHCWAIVNDESITTIDDARNTFSIGIVPLSKQFSTTINPMDDWDGQTTFRLTSFSKKWPFFELGPEALKQLRTDENIKEVKKVPLPKNRFRRHLWATMEYPDYSSAAKIVNIFSLLVILLSTLSLAVESLPKHTDIADSGCTRASTTYTNDTSNNTTKNNRGRSCLCVPFVFHIALFHHPSSVHRLLYDRTVSPHDQCVLDCWIHQEPDELDRYLSSDSTLFDLDHLSTWRRNSNW